MRPSTRLSFAVAVALFLSTAPPPAAAANDVKLAFFNIQSGKGEPGLSGRPVLFADTQNCTDRTLPVNAWGVGFTQAAITSAIAKDPSVVALGLAEAWVCGSPENVRQLLGWAAKTSTRNGVAVLARYGFSGPEVWQQLDTSLNPTPSDTMWVVRVPVCIDAACSDSILMYAAHWYGTGTYKKTMYDRQAQQTVDFIRATAGNEPHVLIGDLNAWEGTVAQCGQKPINAGIPKLRAAGYLDAWPRVHGTAEGFTGMTNRSGCGQPAGYTWKRIDYAWSTPDLEPLDITRFAVPEVIGDAAASDHYGIIASYPAPGGGDPRDISAPAVELLTPAPGSVLSGEAVVDVAVSDDTGIVRVEVIEDGIVRHAVSSHPYRVACDTTHQADGTHTVQARAYDAAGNAAVSAAHTIEIRNTISPPPVVVPARDAADIVLYARRGTAAGSWRVVEDPEAAGGAAMKNPNAGLAKLKTALADPAGYFELTFTPAAGHAYHLWLRGRAEKDSWANDSVFVQFSGSVTAAGAPTYRIGTTSAAAINLEDDSNAGLSGWGWQDNGYGANVLGAPLYFDGTPQTIRVQSREDGLTLDQIVLSSAAYVLTSPGALVHDATILPETVAAAVARDEIVIRASAAATLAGGWRRVTDATAAGGVALAHPDAGGAKLAAALAAPVHYVELTFEADAGRPYRLWLRGRADRNAWANDSVFVQFSGAIDGAGAPRYRIGTTSSTTINLEDGNGAGISGWGWQDNGYGVGVLGEAITFATSGTQTVRIQTREDGLRFDQLVLSTGRYITDAPGSLTNDTTILP